jgi:hypothetical protein
MAPETRWPILGCSARISRDQALAILTEACPSFRPISEKETADRAKSDWYDGDDLLLYPVLSEFARHVVDLYKANQVSEFNDVFSAIERLHTDGDDHVKEAATIGLLEGIQNISGNSRLDAQVFETYLRPESKMWWNKLNDFWSGKRVK